MNDLAAQAEDWGIERSFTDALGRHREVEPDALSRIVDALSSAGQDLKASTVWRGDERSPVLLPADVNHWRLCDQSDAIVTEGRRDNDQADIAGFLPDLPFGTYKLEAVGADSTARLVQHLIVAPRQSYQPNETTADRTWILAVQLYAVRSRRYWGHGDVTDLLTLLRLAAKVGAAGIGLNPLHALFDDRAEQASPYSPNSRLFLNPLYIDVDAIPEFPGLAHMGFAAQVDAARQADFVAYADVAAAKIAGLRLAHSRFREMANASRRDDFARFCSEHGRALQAFAAFEILRRRFDTVWWEWPEHYRHPSSSVLDEVEAECPDDFGYYAYVQWIADGQLRACRDEARRLELPIGLYMDLAVGADPGGADAWSDQTAVVPRMEVGAPPDALNTAGQAWGLAAFNPRALTSDGFAAFSRVLRAVMRYAGAVRLDHVLGLNRLYLIPLGFGAAQGAYVRYPLRELLAVAALESNRHGCVVIGEDLGTVPDDLRGALADWGIWSYLVLMFERGYDGGFRSPHDYRRNALVTFSTHDLPTFPGWIAGHDLGVKRNLGLDPGESDEARWHALHELRAALGRNGIDPPEGALRLFDVLRYLARTPTRLLAVSIEDALGVLDQPNVPGTILEHPNWRRRLPIDIESLDDHPEFRLLAEMMRREGRGFAATATSPTT
jgi:4-alpha-glucanotransferase